jgi:hypothetical protein
MDFVENGLVTASLQDAMKVAIRIGHAIFFAPCTIRQLHVHFERK